MLLSANKAINSIHQHISKMMRISSNYGEKMGALGTKAFNSGEGADFARRTAKMMTNPNTQGGTVHDMLNMIKGKAVKAGMSEKHLATMDSLSEKIKLDVFGTDLSRPVAKTSLGYDQPSTMRLGNKLGLL